MSVVGILLAPKLKLSRGQRKKLKELALNAGRTLMELEFKVSEPKPEAPKLTEEQKKAVAASFLDLLYDKVETLEQAEASPKPYCHILTSNGWMEVRKTPIGLFAKKVTTAQNVPVVPEGLAKRYLPKIPYVLFQQCISFFRRVYTLHKTEAHAQIFWDPDKKEYFIHIPKQSVSSAAVHYEHDQELLKRCKLVLDFHSHHQMGSFFSGTDNKDEKSDRFYAVIGKLMEASPEITFRMIIGGAAREITMWDVFDRPAPVDFPEEWLAQLSLETYKKYESNGSGGFRQINVFDPDDAIRQAFDAGEDYDADSNPRVTIAALRQLEDDWNNGRIGYEAAVAKLAELRKQGWRGTIDVPSWYRGTLTGAGSGGSGSVTSGSSESAIMAALLPEEAGPTAPFKVTAKSLQAVADSLFDGDDVYDLVCRIAEQDLGFMDDIAKALSDIESDLMDGRR